MLVLTNCLTEVVDEGCLKVANSLIKRIKKALPLTYIVTYDREHELSNRHLQLNKLLLSRELKKVIKEKNENVLYMPFSARTIATALRVFVLSRFCKKKLCTVMVQRDHFGFTARLLMKISKSQLLVLSQESFDFYAEFVGKERITYLKTGVDTKKFVPVEEEERNALKRKYGFDENKKLIVHCGHLNYGRNVDKLLDIDSKYQVLLVVSTLTRSEQDKELKAKLLAKDNIKIIEEYIEKMEEIYQMSDAYFFPVRDLGRCIDVPLSCLEAAASGIPVVTTAFGEMKAFKNCSGFFFMDDTGKAGVNGAIENALSIKGDARKAVLPYDWDKAVDTIIKMS